MKTEHPTQSQNTSTSIPAWLTQDAQQAATAGGNLPQYTPYTGAGYAGLTPAQMQALGISQGSAGQGQSIAMGAAPTLNGLQGFNAPQITAGSLQPDIQGLLNPATQDVIDATGRQIDRNTAMSVNASDNSAAANHAFGGDRQAVADGVIRSNADLNKGAITAQLNQGNYNNALSTATGIAQGNQGAAINSAGVRASAAGQTAGLGQTISGLNTGDVGSLLTAGGQQQSTNTNQNLFDFQKYMLGYQLPDQQAQSFASILGSLPHDTSGTSTTTGTSYSSPLMGLAGLGLTAAGFPMAGGGSLGGNFLSGLFGGGGGGSKGIG